MFRRRAAAPTLLESKKLVDSSSFSDEPLFPTKDAAADLGLAATNKHCILKKPSDAAALGLKFEAFGAGVQVTAMKENASSTLLVGDVITEIDGKSTSTAVEATAAIDAARPGASIFITALGGTREVTLDKREGDCGMTCAAVTHLVRGVLLKRVAKGSLADQAKLYPGDTIVAVNGQLINHHAQAVQAIDKIESVVKLVVLGSSQELTIEPKSSTNKAPLGVSLTAHEDKGGAGVKVASVRPDGRAAQAGITAGDSLLSINGQLCVDHKQAVGLLDAVASGAYIKAVVLSKYDGLQ